MIRPYSVQSRQQVRMSVPNNAQWPAIKKLQQHIIKFPYSSYPFPNDKVPADLFNTMVQCNINEQKIDKIVNFKCENVISLKKIVKIKMKDKKPPSSNASQKGKTTVSTYSFYYEKVEYSLGHVLEPKSKQHISRVNKFNLDRTQIKKTLAHVIAALYKQGIITFLEFAHIGINQKGVIKVYIAPNVLFDQHQYNPKTKVLVLTYLNNVLKQIDVRFPKTLKTKQSLESFKSRPQLSIEKDIIDSEESIVIQETQKKKNNQLFMKEKRKEFFGNEEKSFNEEEDNFIGASGSTNLDHLKLQKQMKKKFENHKLASKVQQNIQSQKKSKILTKLQQKQKIDELCYQLEQMRKKIRQKVQEKRERNIFASKAFKTIATQDRTNVRQTESPQKRSNNVYQNKPSKPTFSPIKGTNLNKKRKSSQSSINFYHGLIPNQKNINCINIYNPKHFPQKSYYQMLGDDAMSVDTYQLEIGDDYEMPKMNFQSNMRSSVSPQKQRESFKTASRNKDGERDNQKARFCQSAGGKSFGHIVNLLKPQFIPKKSNIFEEPQNQNQQDSRNSISLKKSIGKEPSDRLSIEKHLQNNSKPKILSSSVHLGPGQIKGLKTVEQFKKDLKNLMSFRMMNQSTEKTLPLKNQQIDTRQTLPMSRQNNGNPEVDLMYLRETQYRPKTNYKKSDILVKKSALQQKVRKAMERTKKAINVLHTAKIRQSGPVNAIKGMSFE